MKEYALVGWTILVVVAAVWLMGLVALISNDCLWHEKVVKPDNPHEWAPGGYVLGPGFLWPPSIILFAVAVTGLVATGIKESK